MAPRDTSVALQAQDLPAPAGGQAPEWIQLLPGGRDIPTVDARGPYRVENAQAVIDASPSRLPIDENHAIDIAAGRGEPSPARGYVVEMQARADGIWGRVDWTAAGRALVADRAYFGISPVIFHDAGKRVVSIARASLTNRPNLRGMVALNQENGMSLTSAAEALGLAGDATEDSILAAIRALKEGATAPQASEAAAQAIAEIGAALGVATDAGPAAVIAAAKAAGQDAKTTVPALQAQVGTLSAEVAQMREGARRAAAEAFLDAEVQAGNTGLNAQNRAEFVAMHMENPARTEKVVSAFHHVAPGAAGHRPAPPAPRAALQAASPGEIVGRARALQAAEAAKGNAINWTDAVLQVSGGVA